MHIKKNFFPKQLSLLVYCCELSNFIYYHKHSCLCVIQVSQTLRSINQDEDIEAMMFITANRLPKILRCKS